MVLSSDQNSGDDPATDTKAGSANAQEQWLEDVIHAPLDAFFRDVQHQSTVIVGSGHRCHVFSDTGKHTTSFTIARDAIRFLVSKNRWRKMDSKERDQFLERLQEDMGSVSLDQ